MLKKIIRILLGLPVWLLVNIIISGLNGRGRLTNLDLLLALIPTILFLKPGRNNKIAGGLTIIFLSFISPSETLELLLIAAALIGYFWINSKENAYDIGHHFTERKFVSSEDSDNAGSENGYPSYTERKWKAVNHFNLFENYMYDDVGGYLYIKKFWIEKGLPRTRNYQICARKINGVIQLDRVGIQFLVGLCNVIIPIPLNMDRNADYVILKNIRLSSGKTIKYLLERSSKI